MTTTTFTSRDFNREPGRVKRAASDGPVFITERSKPSLVVLAFKDYQRLAGKSRSLLDILMPPSSQHHDFEWEPETSKIAAKLPDLDG